MENGEDMSKNRSSISKARSYEEIGDFWDIHDLANYWDKTKSIEIEIDIQSEVTYYAVDKELSEKIRAIAKQHGVSADTLLNLWVQEKLQEQAT
jgi:metal-dependent HD superfamily phosphatase/phosphodiesterase